MPSPLPRVQVRLSEEDYRLVADLAKATRQSMSAVVADVITEAAPVLHRTREMLVSAARLTEEAKSSLRRDLGREEARLQDAVGVAYSALAGAEDAIRRAAGGAERAPRTARKPPKTPR